MINYPEYVEQIFSDLSEQDIRLIAKTVIFDNIIKISDNEYEISELFQQMSNHVKVLPKDKVISVINATSLALALLIYKERDITNPLSNYEQKEVQNEP